MVAGSALYLGLGIAGAYLDGTVGVVCGAAVSTWVGALLWWLQLRTAMREANDARLLGHIGRHRLPKSGRRYRIGHGGGGVGEPSVAEPAESRAALAQAKPSA